MVDMIRNRLKQPLLELYAVDYKDGVATDETPTLEDVRDGMVVLAELRSLESRLAACAKLAGLLNASGRMQLAELSAEIASSLDAGVPLGKGMARKFWARVLAQKFEDKDYKGFASCVAADVDGCLPESFSHQLTLAEKVVFQEQQVVNYMIKLLQAENMLPAVRTFIAICGVMPDYFGCRASKVRCQIN
jgi:hypothetical protein